MTTLDCFHQSEQATTIGRDLHEIGSRLGGVEDEVFLRGGMPVLALAEDELVKFAMRVLNLTCAVSKFNREKRRPIAS
jgi:hypothetical protein